MQITRKTNRRNGCATSSKRLLKQVILMLFVCLLGCGFVDKPNKSDLIKKCKREEFNKLFIIGTCRPRELDRLNGCFEMLYLAYMGCEKKDFSITGPF